MTTGETLWTALFLITGLVFLAISIFRGFDSGTALAGAAFIYLAQN